MSGTLPATAATRPASRQQAFASRCTLLDLTSLRDQAMRDRGAGSSDATLAPGKGIWPDDADRNVCYQTCRES